MSESIDLIRQRTEAKKAKLAEIRRKKEERELASKVVADGALSSSSSSFSSSLSSFSTKSSSAIEETAEDVLNSINSLLGPSTSTNSTGFTVAQSAPTTSSSTSTSASPLSSASSSASTTATFSSSSSSSASTTFVSSSSSSSIVLSLSTQAGIDIMAEAPVETYEKEIQTEADWVLPTDDAQTDVAQQRIAQLEEKVAQLMREEIKLKSAMATLEAEKAAALAAKETLEKVGDPKPFLPVDRRAEVEASVGFTDFLSRTSMLMERALGAASATYDFTIDYAALGDKDVKGDAEDKHTLTESIVFKEGKRTKDRTVTSLNFSPTYRELLLASYCGQEDTLSLDPDGLILVWNQHVTTRPEYAFVCQSEIMTAQFHPSNPRLIVGGTRSGQVLIWDTRQKGSPVNRTSFSKGHTHPVFSLVVLPDVNDVHNLVSVSTDGHLCVWNENNLVQPTTELHLEVPGIKGELTTTCIDFPSKSISSNQCILGSYEGFLYKTSLYDNGSQRTTGRSANQHDGSKGIYESIAAHEAPITSVQFHPTNKQQHNSIMSEFFLTSSYDWTIKLWSNKVLSSKPLFTFESARDYVHDVQWSPTHPSLFATGDGAGIVDVWNVLDDRGVPQCSMHVEATTTTTAQGGGGGQQASISRLKWADHGQQIAVGTSSGSVHLANLSAGCATANKGDASTFYEKCRNRASELSVMTEAAAGTQAAKKLF